MICFINIPQAGEKLCLKQDEKVACFRKNLPHLHLTNFPAATFPSNLPRSTSTRTNLPRRNLPSTTYPVPLHLPNLPGTISLRTTSPSGKRQIRLEQPRKFCRNGTNAL